MGSLNKFKLLNDKCNSYYKILEKSLGENIDIKKESDKPRFGFYMYMLECLSNIKDIRDLVSMITDTDFNKCIFNDPSNDCGIDAVYIDDEKKVINIFNFKYREKYNADKKQSQNYIFISTKFTSAILNNCYEHLEGKIREFARIIIEKNNSNEIWKMKLYTITNEAKSIDRDDSDIKQLKEVYDLEVDGIALPEISNFMSIRPAPIDAKLILDKESVLTYTESSLSSAKSYLIRVSLCELIRITCNSKEYRNKYNIEDISPLNEVDIDFAVLCDNVRGFLGKTKYNKNILDTLKEEPTRFFMYNNGLTITAEDIEAIDINGRKKVSINIKNLQVVNGGQTLRTIYSFKDLSPNNLENYLCDAEILVRIFKTGTSDILSSKISEYTNSQNSISIIDLKSIATEQIQIEQFLDNNNIIYSRKMGDTGMVPGKNYDYKISLEKFAQILYSINGNPEKATNQKKKIFEKYYEETFGEKNFDISKSANIVRRYYEIEKCYKGKTYEYTDQKAFYLMYLDNRYSKSIDKNIEILEETIKEYKKSEEISPARKLIQKGFKDYLDDKCGIKIKK